jgi:hypothetical protein
MSHFAKLDENDIVTFVTVGRQEDDGLEAELSTRTGETYKQTSYNTHGGVHALGGKPFRKNYAGIGYTYDKKLDAFIAPKPYPSWKLDKKSCLWVAPISMPEDGATYVWDENTQSWDAVSEA